MNSPMRNPGDLSLVRWAGPVMLVAYVGCVIFTGIVDSIVSRSDAVGVWTLLPMGTLAAFGALITFKDPRNIVGWIFCLTGALWGLGSFAESYGTYSLVVRDLPLPGTALAAWIGEWFWIPYLSLCFIGLPLLFPTGRTKSPAWRVFGRVAFTAVVAVTAAAALDPTLDLAASKLSVENPIGLPVGADPDDGGWPALVLLAAIGLGGPAAVTSLFLRFRASRGIEQQQLKWFLFGTAVFLVGFVAAGVVDAAGLGRPPSWAESLLFSFLPASGAIAILRFRLYDIDVLINRTLVYVSLTTILAAGYFGLVVAFQAVLAPVTRESDVAVAASTLAIAALFGPVRRRVQSFIDRRFYRSRYDAQETLAQFSARLRDEVDLDHLSAELVGIVATTMRPRHASLWLRPTEASRA